MTNMISLEDIGTSKRYIIKIVNDSHPTTSGVTVETWTDKVEAVKKKVHKTRRRQTHTYVHPSKTEGPPN